MSRFYSYIASAAKIIQTYGGGKPLSQHLRLFFSSDKKYGSKDRRLIASLCYGYYRTGKAFPGSPVEEKILHGFFLCERRKNPLLELHRPDLNNQIELSLEAKMALTGIDVEHIFPFTEDLNQNIDAPAYTLSFFTQPGIFLRMRPHKKPEVINKLRAAGILFTILSETCVMVPSHIAVHSILKLNEDAVVQDLNSQRVLDYLEKTPLISIPNGKVSAWDGCAASGGKSILLHDKLGGNIHLTVSDIRDNILSNLKERLSQASVTVSKSFVADLTKNSGLEESEKFSIIVCDAPCSGSGTWARNPEQMFFFKRKMISEYAARQQKIAASMIPHLQDGGLFFYITCSVFEKENEDVVAIIEKKFPLHLLQQEYLKGYEIGADTMFVAVFVKNSS